MSIVLIVCEAVHGKTIRYKAYVQKRPNFTLVDRKCDAFIKFIVGLVAE